jgi:AGZA family xanthine/uracil permease-like MFS transporter
MSLQDILAAIGVILNGIPQGLLALSFGFAAMPTALAFVVGMIGAGVFQSVAPISFQAETITLANKLGNNKFERLSAIFFGGAGMALIGVFGLLETIVQLIGPEITYAMMAGVGIMLAFIAIELGTTDKIVGMVSVAVAIIMWVVTASLVHTIIWSVVAGCTAGRFAKFEPVQHDEANETLKVQPLVWKFWTNPRVIRGALALITLNIGANITFGKLTGQIAGAEVNVDHLAIYSSLADMASSLFGGSPVESIISATADAPHPMLSGIIMMGIFAVILFTRLLPRIGHYVPRASIAGFLLVLGAIVTLPTNVQLAFQNVNLQSPMAAVLGTVIVITARFDPFVGMISGIALRALFQIWGVM